MFSTAQDNLKHLVLGSPTRHRGLPSPHYFKKILKMLTECVTMELKERRLCSVALFPQKIHYRYIRKSNQAVLQPAESLHMKGG